MQRAELCQFQSSSAQNHGINTRVPATRYVPSKIQDRASALTYTNLIKGHPACTVLDLNHRLLCWGKQRKKKKAVFEGNLN